MRTLVVHTGGIGDFLLTGPALRQLATQGPVELLGNPARLQLAVVSSIAVAARDIESVDFDSLFHTPSDRLRRFLARFARCVVWMRDDGTIERGIRACGVAKVHAFPGVPPAEWRDHASRYFLRCLHIDQAPHFELTVDPSDSLHDVIIHPGSGSRRKNWPRERFLILAEILSARDRTVTWCVGPAEQDFPLPRKSAVLQAGSLVALARELASARLYIGNDSGITHLAAAVGCRTVAIFGPTDPYVWAPLGPHVAVVYDTPWPTVEAVIEGIKDEG
jgi:ADP-heptose:LPS heptosyltransferase